MDLNMLNAGSPERFGFQWDKYSELIPAYEELFRRWTHPLAPNDWAGQLILDAGCGMGRNIFYDGKPVSQRHAEVKADECLAGHAAAPEMTAPQAIAL